MIADLICLIFSVELYRLYFLCFPLYNMVLKSYIELIYFAFLPLYLDIPPFHFLERD